MSDTGSIFDSVKKFNEYDDEEIMNMYTLQFWNEGFVQGMANIHSLSNFEKVTIILLGTYTAEILENKLFPLLLFKSFIELWK